MSRGDSGIEAPDRPAAMRKAFAVFALIAFTCGSSRDILVHGDPIGKPEDAGRSDDYERQVRTAIRGASSPSPTKFTSPATLRRAFFPNVFRISIRNV